MYLDNRRLTTILKLKAPRRHYLELWLAFHAIADGIAKRFTWTNAMDREDAVADATLFCIEHLDRFDTTRGTSPLSYFTQMAKNRLRRSAAKRSREMRPTQLPDDGQEEARA